MKLIQVTSAIANSYTNPSWDWGIGAGLLEWVRIQHKPLYLPCLLGYVTLTCLVNLYHS